jgi:hypothetical protein
MYKAKLKMTAFHSFTHFIAQKLGKHSVVACAVVLIVAHVIISHAPGVAAAAALGDGEGERLNCPT